LGLERIAIHIADTGDKVALFRSYNSAPILVMFYEMLVRTLPEVQTICWDLVVCDEAHRMIKTSSSLGKLACRRKLLLTGTPVQNDLGE
jgi:SNF2 family DNA or RNA helicase